MSEQEISDWLQENRECIPFAKENQSIQGCSEKFWSIPKDTKGKIIHSARTTCFAVVFDGFDDHFVVGENVISLLGMNI